MGARMMSDKIVQFPIQDTKRVFAAMVANQAYFERRKEEACQCYICQVELSTSTTEI
jgi:hypothetical protein